MQEKKNPTKWRAALGTGGANIELVKASGTKRQRLLCLLVSITSNASATVEGELSLTLKEEKESVGTEMIEGPFANLFIPKLALTTTPGIMPAPLPPSFGDYGLVTAPGAKIILVASKELATGKIRALIGWCEE